MMMPHFDPVLFWTEFVYTLVILSFCFVIYFKTSKIYDLTKYKGIQYFRTAFALFGFAYLIRFIFSLDLISKIAFDSVLPFGFIFPLFLILLGYFSTMAIFYLVYSTIWKKIKYSHFLVFSNLTAAVLVVISSILRSHQILFLIQMLLIIPAIAFIFLKKTKNKKALKTKLLYILTFLFWLINLFFLGPNRILPYERIALHIISLIVFFVICYKVYKWVK